LRDEEEYFFDFSMISKKIENLNANTVEQEISYLPMPKGQKYDKNNFSRAGVHLV